MSFLFSGFVCVFLSVGHSSFLFDWLSNWGGNEKENSFAGLASGEVGGCEVSDWILRLDRIKIWQKLSNITERERKWMGGNFESHNNDKEFLYYVEARGDNHKVPIDIVSWGRAGGHYIYSHEERTTIYCV